MLIEARVEQRLEELVSLIEHAAQNPDPWHGLTRFLEQRLELQSRERGFKELVLGAPDGLHANHADPCPRRTDALGPHRWMR